MDLAHRLIDQHEVENPHQKKLPDLQKAQLACDFLKMNSKPVTFSYYKRFIDNEGDVKIPGFDPITGQRIRFIP